MRSSILVCALIIGLVAAGVAEARTKHSLLVGDELVHRSTSESASVDPRMAQLSAAMKVDWTRSIYEGIDRTDRVKDDTASQIKLSYIPQGMAVSFSTASSYVAPNQPTVLYGFAPNALNNKAVGPNGESYGTLWFHTVLLSQLTPHTRYYYQVVGSSLVSSFVTAPRTGDASPFSVLVVGDMGLTNSADTMKRMTTALNDTDFYMHIGDLSYADDFYLRKGDTYEGSWDKWQDEMEPITANIPYMTLPGNHEVVCTEVTPFLCPKVQNNMTAYRYRFRMPSQETGGASNLWFSYDYGLVHFIHINTETDYPDSPMGPGTFYNAGPFGDQMSWLEADLIAATSAREAGTVPWIVVSGHRPLYSSHKSNSAAIAAFEKLFIKYNVDIYFSGHVHWYERLWPLSTGGVVTQQNYTNPTGVVYLVNGAAGNVEGLNSGTAKAFAAYIDDTDFGYGKLFVQNSTAINWKYYHSSDNTVGDDIWIFKSH